MTEPTKAAKVAEEAVTVVHDPFVPNVELINESFAKHPPPAPERSFKRMIRNMRRAQDLATALGGCEVRRKRDGRKFHVLPGALFDEVTAFLARMGKP